jgi:hypothetical protein
MIESEQAHIDLYNKYLTENRTGVREGKPVTTQKIVTTMGAVAPGYNPNEGTRYEYTPATKIAKHSESEMSKLRNLAREAKQKISIYNSYLNSDGSVDYDKLVRAGYLDQNGVPTEYFMREINKLNKAS